MLFRSKNGFAISQGFMLATLCTAIGCGTPTAVALKPVTYSFNEPEGAKVNVTLGILKPSHSYEKKGCVDVFADAFKKNIFEMMVAKGMNTKGPFDGIDEMTFPDKKGSDLVIQTDLDFKIINQLVKLEIAHPFTEAIFSGSSTKNATYKFTAGPGTLLLSALEPLSREKMWFKKIELPAIEKTYELEIDNEKGQNAMIATVNECQEALLGFFKSSMPKVSQYLNAEEMAQLKAQSQELREKKKY